MSPDNNWEQYIVKRGELLADWRRKQQQQIMKTLAEKWIYIRVGGDKYRPVSIHPDNPCGCLKRLKGSVSEIGCSKILNTALNDANAAAPANTKKPGTKKPEHVVQAGLIHHALSFCNDNALQELNRRRSPYDVARQAERNGSFRSGRI